MPLVLGRPVQRSERGGARVQELKRSRVKDKVRLTIIGAHFPFILLNPFLVFVVPLVVTLESKRREKVFVKRPDSCR